MTTETIDPDRTRARDRRLPVLVALGVIVGLNAACPDGTNPPTFTVELACPDTVIAGVVFPHPVVAAALDGSGAALATRFEVALADGPAGTVLMGTTSLESQDGSVEFGDLSLSVAGDHTLTVTADAMASAACDVHVVAEAHQAGPLLWIEKMDVFHTVPNSAAVGPGSLRIDGIFAAESVPTVMLDGSGLDVTTWSDSLIVAAVPETPFAGPVTAWWEGWPSNAVPLTGWNASFAYELTIEPDGTTGSWRQSVDCELGFRADAHPPKPSPGAEPVHRLAPIIGTVPSSTCTFEMSGTVTTENGSITASGSGEADHILLGRIDASTRQLEILLMLLGSGTLTGPGFSQSFTIVNHPGALFGVEGCDVPEIPDEPTITDLPMFALPMDALSSGGLSVEAGSRSFSTTCGSDMISATLSWQAIPAVSPAPAVDLAGAGIS